MQPQMILVVKAHSLLVMINEPSGHLSLISMQVQDRIHRHHHHIITTNIMITTTSISVLLLALIFSFVTSCNVYDAVVIIIRIMVIVSHDKALTNYRDHQVVPFQPSASVAERDRRFAALCSGSGSRV